MEKINQKNFYISKCKIRNVRVEQHNLYIKVNPQYLLQRLLKLQPPQQPQRLPLLVKSDLVNSGLADAAGIDDGGGDVRPPQRLRHIELKSGEKTPF